MRQAHCVYEEVRDRFGMKSNAIASIVPSNDARNIKQVPCKLRKVLDAFLVCARKPELPLHAADVTVADEITEKRAEIGIDFLRYRNQFSLRRKNRSRVLLVRVQSQGGREIFPRTSPSLRADDGPH